MPTGSGKSAVFMALPFALQSSRVLILTTSRVVRDQIAEDYTNLSTLKKLGVITDRATCPRVRTVQTRGGVRRLDQERDQYDVAVALPNVFQSLDPGQLPPRDLFNLVIIDEAHHAAAPSWTAVAQHFSEGLQTLFTATPVRRDRKTLGARYVYVYPLAQALKDQVFGEVVYSPVRAQEGLSIDQVIARETQAVFLRDRARGLDHRVLVRVDTRSRADELGRLYESETDLKLRVIHSGHTYSRVQKALEDLKAGLLDGLVAVDMLGEGFDFPKLKIGAVHTPHKSLSATLQFIGRFARTNDADVGTATFIGAENDIKHQAKALWTENAAWRDMVPSLADTQIHEDMVAQEFFETLEASPPLVDQLSQVAVSAESLRPAAHVKVYETMHEPDLETSLALSNDLEVCFSWYSAESNTRVVIVLERRQPSWTDDPTFARLEFELIILHYHSASRALFVGSSRRTDDLYESIARCVTHGRHSIIPMFKLRRILRGLNGLECFTVGMRNRLVGTVSESYRIMVGPNAQRAIRNADSVAYHQGHVFTRGDRQGRAETLGYSSSSKVWSAGAKDVAGFVAWCDHLGTALIDGTEFTIDPDLDKLPSGRAATIPIPPLLAALWPKRAYERQLKLTWTGKAKLLRDVDIWLPIRTTEAPNQAVQLVADGEIIAELVFDPVAQPFFCYRFEPNLHLTVSDHVGTLVIPLLDFLNNEPPQFFTHDFSSFVGNEYFASPSDIGLYEREKIAAYDWVGADVDITCETKRSKRDPGKKFILEEYCSILRREFAYVFVDDGTGEAADIVACNIHADRVNIMLAHCKASMGEKPGHRVDDVYVVAGQVIKSVRLFGQNRKLRDHLASRSGIEVVAGNLNDVLLSLMNMTQKKLFEVRLVQPGISKSEITPDMLRPLAAAEDYVLTAGGTFFVFVSP